jgi:hypothetical protein
LIVWSAGPDPVSSTASPVAPCSAPEGIYTGTLWVSWSWFSILLESNDQLKISYHYPTRKSTLFLDFIRLIWIRPFSQYLL